MSIKSRKNKDKITNNFIQKLGLKFKNVWKNELDFIENLFKINSFVFY